MHLYIYLQARDISTISFQTPFKSFLRNEFPELVIFEADQASDPSHIQTGVKFIDEADRIILHIEDDGKTSLGSNMKLLEKLRKAKCQKRIFYSGSTKTIVSSLKMLSAEYLQNDFEVEIRNFLK